MWSTARSKADTRPRTPADLPRRLRDQWAEQTGRQAGLDLRLGVITEYVTKGMSGEYRKALRRDPCAYCGAPGGVLDHIECIGGSGRKRVTRGDLFNLTGSCAECNGVKRTSPLLHALVAIAIQRQMRPLAELMGEWVGRRYMVRPKRR